MQGLCFNRAIVHTALLWGKGEGLAVAMDGVFSAGAVVSVERRCDIRYNAVIRED